MNALVAGPQLDKLAVDNGLNTTEKIARPVQIVLRREAKFAKRNVPYKTLLKKTTGNVLAVEFMESGKKELIPICDIFSQTPMGNIITIKDVTYDKETLNGYPRYVPQTHKKDKK